MNYLHKVLSCSCVLLISLSTPASSDFAHLPGKSSVIVLQGEVTVDGLPRPDLGRSFSDTITGGLLKSKAYSVVDHLSSQPLSEAIEKNPNIAPEQSAVAFGKTTGSRWIMVPRMIVEGDFHKLTMKKIRVSDGQVVEVFESQAIGDRSQMFELIGESLKWIYADTARDRTRLRRENAGPAVRDLSDPPVEKKDPPAIETKVASNDKEHIPAEVELNPEPELVAEPPEIKDPAVETEEETAALKGTISTINPEWRFCILKLNAGHELQIGDELSIKTGNIVPTKHHMTITKIEGRQAVADLLEGAEIEPLKVGQKFYQWSPR